MAFISLAGPVITFHPQKWLDFSLFLPLVVGGVTGEEYILFWVIFRPKIRTFEVVAQVDYTVQSEAGPVSVFAQRQGPGR